MGEVSCQGGGRGSARGVGGGYVQAFSDVDKGKVGWVVRGKGNK